MTHRSSMDISSMLNDDSADSKKSPPSRPSQSHPTLPSVPQLQTAHSSAISNTYTQSPVVGTPQAYPPSYAQTPHLDRRSSSHQSQSQYAQTGTPMTPHTPAHHPGYAQQGYFTHAHQPSPSYAPRSSSSYARSENSQPPPGYVASPQSYPNVAPSTPFGPSLRDPDGLMQPPRESPIARRHGSAVLTQPVTPGPPYAPSIPAQYRPPLSESPITNGRESLSVSPKTLPNTLPPRSRESSVRYESATPDQLKRSSDAGESKSVLRSSLSQEVKSRDVANPSSSVPAKREITPMAESRGLKRERTSTTSISTTNDTIAPPHGKKRKVREIPIWAQPAKHVRKLAKYKDTKTSRNLMPVPAAHTSQAAGPVAAPAAAPIREADLGEKDEKGPLGLLEHSMHGLIYPYEDLSRKVCDWLFQQVVFNKTLGTTKVGEPPLIEGAIEIEAKIGTILDVNTKDRFRLPISSETVLAEGFDVGFESLMTMEQHKGFNDYLNKALSKSHEPYPAQPGPDDPKRPRIPMAYKHTREVDTFYPLPPSELQALPPPVQEIVKRGTHRTPRVRVTRDQKTNAVSAKVIKARIADLHVSCPNQDFDYRLSINLEANWDGDLGSLIGDARTQFAEPKDRDPPRYKDRVSYTHQFVQIDLTQVKPDANAKRSSASHELEIELDSRTVKEQGQRVLDGQPNQYEPLVRAFLDNVRVLIRAGGK